ncbi:aminotransferase class V-fold PLP-dependent enzyme [Paenibacillus sp. GbtcB18]|uniref:aminotransferase class V-fold PLP-dependent enzyme n=1 Tax=Paenibacillus sp. GbtcB18 TaxID=2824763 RepID=UPI002815CD7E|nr:aminotransferase class V-fold PLP-dependent enzyme [Paenibacillus sp. GbtcB18]
MSRGYGKYVSDTLPGYDPIINRMFAPDWSDEEHMEAAVKEMIHRFQHTTQTHTVDSSVIASQYIDSLTPERPVTADDFLEHLMEHVIPYSSKTSSPRFIGHMTSALPYFVKPLSKLVVALHQNVVKVETSATLTFYERQALGMMHRLVFENSEAYYDKHVQNSESTLGVAVSGGTVANLTALWCARNKALGPCEGFAGIGKTGMQAAMRHYGYTEAVVVGSSLMHYSFEKAVDLFGFGENNLIKVPVDEQHRINLNALYETLFRCQQERKLVVAVIGIAGSTESGSIDPLQEISALCRRFQTHFHVDAAWGGPLLFSSRYRDKLIGLSSADSVTIDGHKQFYLPMGLGMVLFKDQSAAKTIEKDARYIIRKGSLDLGKRSLEGSRPGNTLLLHAALQMIGKRGYESLIDYGMYNVNYMVESIQARKEFELLIQPQTNIILYRYIPVAYREKAVNKSLTEAENKMINAFNEELQSMQLRAGQTFVSRTTVLSNQQEPIVALRAVISNPLTTGNDIDAVLDEQAKIAQFLT